ncbi:MAG: hypothetical protein KGY70_11515 [Bacteroidales bacterium]|nr:hypothetical protein [Bacteroidales bacterium]
MKTNETVTNEAANLLIENFQVEKKNAADLNAAQKVEKLQEYETIGDVIKQADIIFPEMQNKKFKGENIRVLVFFRNGNSFVELTLQKYDGKVETLCKTVADKVFARFATMKGKKKMNVLLVINDKKMEVKTGGVYQMNKNSIHRGTSALVALQSYAYMK